MPGEPCPRCQELADQLAEARKVLERCHAIMTDVAGSLGGDVSKDNWKPSRTLLLIVALNHGISAIDAARGAK